MNNIELKTPKTINDLRIHHNDILSDEKYNKPFVEGDKLNERLINKNCCALHRYVQRLQEVTTARSNYN